MEKRCELCGDCATLYCPADNANVCWSCDAEVHSANFLVARHIRTVMCSNCCEPTNFKIVGPHPSPLSRLCSLCNPPNVTRPVENCNGDSEEKEKSETLSNMSAANDAEDSGCTCASQESHTGRYTTIQARRKQVVEIMARARVSRGQYAAESRRYEAHERGKKIQGRRNKKRSSSPTGLGIQALQLEAGSLHTGGGRLEGSGMGSNSVSPTNQLLTAPLFFQLLDKEADESSCVSYVDEEGSEQ